MAMVLSGGEKQRLGIARAMYKKASVIFADEPTASLDEANRQLVISLLKDCANRGAAIILATHDERLVNECDTVISLNNNNVSDDEKIPVLREKPKGCGYLE